MASSPLLRARLSIFAALIILFACSTVGLLSGAVIHTLANQRSSNSPTTLPVITGTLPGQAAPTATLILAPTATPGAMSTATGFTLAITSSSRTLRAGETFTITVVATAHGAPVVGLPCTLRAPVSGPPGLFTTWPAPVNTDANGKATWTLTVPPVSAGTYGIEVDALGGHAYDFHRYTTIQVA